MNRASLPLVLRKVLHPAPKDGADLSPRETRGTALRSQSQVRLSAELLRDRGTAA